MIPKNSRDISKQSGVGYAYRNRLFDIMSPTLAQSKCRPEPAHIHTMSIDCIQYRYCFAAIEKYVV